MVILMAYRPHLKEENNNKEIIIIQINNILHNKNEGLFIYLFIYLCVATLF